MTCIDCGGPTSVAYGDKKAIERCRPCNIAWRKTPSYRASRAAAREARFHGYIHKTDGCWYWVGSTNGGGYGQFYSVPLVGKPRLVLAHKLTFEAVKGPVGRGRELHHTCRERLCVNPDHLEALTRAEHRQRHTLRVGGQTMADKTAKRAEYRLRHRVPCDGGCGRLVEGKGRPNVRPIAGKPVPRDPNRPHLCHACAMRRQRKAA